MSAVQNVYLGREVAVARTSILRMLNVVNDRAMRTRAREVLKELQVGIQSVNVSVKGMSGGQRQCLAIARALIWGRRIVILDEPTAALGVRESKQVLELDLAPARPRGERHPRQPQHAAARAPSPIASRSCDWADPWPRATSPT